MTTRQRERREFRYRTLDSHEGQPEDWLDGMIAVSWGPFSWRMEEPAPIMVHYEDACWMDKETAVRFGDWLTATLAEAREWKGATL